jgi:hypothetical protein
VGGGREPYSWRAETTNIYPLVDTKRKFGGLPEIIKTFKTQISKLVPLTG